MNTSSIASTGLPGAAVLVSKARLAFAYTILEHKPNDLPVQEYFTQLRACIQQGSRSSTGSDLRHMSSIEFWQDRCAEKDSKLSDLTAQVRRLTVENKQLSTDGKRFREELDELQQRTGKRRKKIATQVTTSGTVVPSLQSWEVEQKVYRPLASASKDLLSQLQCLALASTSKQIASALQDVCMTFAMTVDNLCTGQPARNTTEAGAMANIHKARLLDSAWIEKVNRAVDQVFRRIKTSISIFSTIVGRKNLKRTEGVQQEMLVNENAIIGQLFKLLVSIVDSIHANSVALLEELAPDSKSSKETVRDIRTGLTDSLISFITNLQAEVRMERNVMQGAFFIILEAAGKCLCLPRPPNNILNDSTDVKQRTHHVVTKLALGETSYYVLECVKRVLPVYQQHAMHAIITESAEEGHLGILAKARFHEVIMLGVFGCASRDDDKLRAKSTGLSDQSCKNIREEATAKGTRWSNMHAGCDFDMVQSQFSTEIWELLGLQGFAMAW